MNPAQMSAEDRRRHFARINRASLRQAMGGNPLPTLEEQQQTAQMMAMAQLGHMYGTYRQMIYQMNIAFDCGVAEGPTIPLSSRIQEFMAAIIDEAKEGSDVITKINKVKSYGDDPQAVPEDQRDQYIEDVLDAFVALYDWLGDLHVFIESEMARVAMPFGVLHDIMQSNMSKLGPDGKRVPHPDIPGKFGKGPNFVPPEETIRANLRVMLGFDPPPIQEVKSSLILP